MTIDLDFFGLAEPPFNPTPDPRFLYMTPGHREALAQLLHAVQGRKGFILLTGEIGTGKTTLLHSLLRRLGDTMAVAFITNTMLGFEGILEYMLEDLGVAKPGDSHAQRLIALQSFLTERRRAGQNTVLILDEAQDLDVRTLEYIRLLSNFETPTEKILQILLVGQPELRAKLDLPELRQLYQRLALRCRIPPLAPDEVGHYIRNRLRVARTHDLALFSHEAVARIARYSGGIPRLVNTVCDHCLVFAYADKVRRIDRGIVDQVIDYLQDGEPRRRGKALPTPGRWHMTPRRWGVLGASAAAAGLTGLLVAHPAVLWQAARSARALLGL
jgi:general secretion pathway protein A